MISRIGAVVMVIIAIYCIFIPKEIEVAILCYCIAIFGLVIDIHIKNTK